MNKLKEYRPFGVSDGTHYTYYIDNLRKSKDDTYFIWLDGNMVYEFTDDDSNTYTYGHRLISSDDAKYVLNAHGDVVALLNDNGAVTKRYDYDAFGNELNIDTADTNPFRYCAEYFDTETGTIYLRARYYSPTTGRFTQLDPIRDGLNWYAYCTNNPIQFIDPSGEIAITTIIFIASVVVGVAAGSYTAYQSYKYTGKIDWTASIVNGLSWGMIAYSCGMSAYAVYVDFCKYNGYTPVSQVNFTSNQSFLQQAANNVKSTSNGHVSGTKQHSAFKKIIDSSGRSNLRTEVSFLNGKEVPYGTKNSVRLDVVEYDNSGNIVAAYDLKTGTAKLTNARIQQIQSHLPNNKTPIFEIKPE